MSTRATDQERRASSARRRIIAVSAALLVFSAAQTIIVAPSWTSPTGSIWPMWWSLGVLTITFAATEIFVVHLRIRADAHTFSLVELPLALGLFFVDPVVLLAAHLIGAGIALRVHRKQSGIKLLFNLAVFACATTTAVVILHLMRDDRSLSASTLASGALALVAAGILSVLLVFVAIFLSAGKLSIAELRTGLLFGALTTGCTASLGIISVVVADAQPGIAWLLLVPAGGTYLASWAYTTQRRRHEGLDFLYQSARLLHQADDIDTAIRELLRNTCATFNTATAELYSVSNSGVAQLDIRCGLVSADERPEIRELRRETLLTLVQRGESLNLTTGADGAGGRFLGLSSYRNAIVAPLKDDDGVYGAMVIANRLSDVVSFDSTDVRLAETLAHHTATALKNGRLEQSLEQLRVMEEQLVFQAHHDPLTGLGNRVLFIAALDQLLSEHLGAQGAVLFIDLDDFKTVNDSFGHASGDALLSEVANRLRSTLEADHTIARLGGDEFAVLVPDATERTKVELWARTLLAVFESPVATTTRPLRIRASIGVAMIQPGDEAGSVMRNADTAMYAAKAQGKHRFAFFESAMFEANLSRYNLQLDLQSSISQHQVRAVYQPIVRLDTKQLIGVEALVRWDHPTLGELLPGSFLEVAAECGMLDRLDHAVLEQACEWLAETDRAHPGLVPWVNVNLSPSTLLDPTCVSWVQSTLRRHGLQPNRLGVEVTENLMSADADLAVEALHRLRELGVQLSLDDFGTGYSSLSYLQRLPVGVVKIAKSFVDDVETIPNQRALLEAIVAMGRALDMFIVAEGVEQMQQVRLLESLGCAAGQGFAFSRSLRPAEFVKWALGWENERCRASESTLRASDDARRTLRPVG